MFRVQISKDYLVFCSAHFITYEGHRCENLHGHNYRVAVTIEGDLDENWYVFDFVTLKKIMKRLVDEIDHVTLLPAHNPLIVLAEEGDHLTATYKTSSYRFPRAAVVILPIENTTAELLARYLAGRLRQELAERGAHNLYALEIEVEESFGQAGIYREQLKAATP